jgi:hypothetical protein
MAFTTSRRSAAGRPPLGVPDFGFGRSGSRCSHWSSVKSVGYGFRVMPDRGNRTPTSVSRHTVNPKPFGKYFVLDDIVLPGFQPAGFSL